MFGRLAHETIEAHANGLDPLKHLARVAKRDDKMFRSQREEYGDIVYDTTAIMIEYFEYWGNSLTYVPLSDDKKAEHSFEVEIAKDIVAVGKIDAVGKWKGLRTLVEHKTAARMPNEDSRWRQVQDAIYIRVNDMLGLKPLDGTLWDYIRSKSPARPQVLKDGSLSAKGLDTLPVVVRDIMEEHSTSERDRKYAGLVKQAIANRPNYFQRIFSPLKKNTVDLVWASFLNTAKDIARDPEKSDMNIGFGCQMCDFEPICRAKLTNSDYHFVIEKDYYVSEGKQDEPDLTAD